MNQTDIPDRIVEDQAGLPANGVPEAMFGAASELAAPTYPTETPMDVVADQEPNAQSISPSSGAQQDFKALLELAHLQQERLDALQRSFDSKIKYDLNKEKVIDSLHRELQAYRDDLVFKILRPVLLDLIAAYDDLDSLLKHVRAQDACCESEARLRRNLETFLHTIEDILYRNGVEVFSEVGSGFIAQRQRSIKIVETAVLEQDRLIAEHIRKGFAYEGKTLRPELVATFKFVTSGPTEDSERSQ